VKLRWRAWLLLSVELEYQQNFSKKC
jgi:hypothetical protein